MFLDFIRKIEYVRIISFIAIAVIVVIEKMYPGTTTKMLDSLTGAIALLGILKSYFPYEKPVAPTLDEASNPLNQ
jgi:predicted membrane channel-forming protein YqfA (hemolysin III family)